MIDWARVEELKEEVGAEDFAEIAALFLSELGEVIDALGASCDPAVLRDGYHGLKGSALNLGFAQVAELCAAAEAAPETADLGRVRAACAAAEAELTARYPAIPA